MDHDSELKPKMRMCPICEFMVTRQHFEEGRHTTPEYRRQLDIMSFDSEAPKGSGKWLYVITIALVILFFVLMLSFDARIVK